MSATLLETHQVDLGSAVVGLRLWADKIERGEVQCDTVVLVLGSSADCPVRVTAFGKRASWLEVLGWLSRAQAYLLT